MALPRPPPRYAGDEELAYARLRWRHTPGTPFRFDEAYRVAHLPLVAPEHAAAIHAAPGRHYRSGRYDEARYSLVVPIDAAALAASTTLQDVERDLARRSFAAKIAWALLPRRASKLHVTLAGNLEPAALARHADSVRRALAEPLPLRYRLGGPFCGEKNHGRIYFTAHPERVDGGDAFARLQASVGAATTGLYVLGYYNLLDELTPPEAAELGDFLERWRDASVAELEATSLVILAHHDDLALDSHAAARIPADP
jgi:hypothetical protein